MLGRIFLPILFIVLSPPAHASKFANQFIEFELPPQWKCQLEGAEWVCQDETAQKKKEAIIILAAKLKGEQDSLDQYMAYLNAPKVFTNVQGKQVKSQPKFPAHPTTINNQVWVDSLHLESEIPGFYTRYLATIKSDIGVLVTYSVNKTKYQEYQNEFETMVKTLKVFRKPGSGGLNSSPNNDLFNVTIPSGISANSVFNTPIQGGSDQPNKAPAQQTDIPLPLILGAVALVAYFIWRRRQNR